MLSSRVRSFEDSSRRLHSLYSCRRSKLSPWRHLTSRFQSEQLIPMLGLTALEHKVKPETTLEKIFFLVEFGFTSAHHPTFVVSACALGTLVMLRLLKASLRRFKWVARVPEVLFVVIVSTRTFLFQYRSLYRLSVCSSIG